MAPIGSELIVPLVKRIRRDPGTLTEFRNRVGQKLAFRVTGSTEGTVWGTDVYTNDSSLAAAAVHAGLLEPGEEGIVLATIMPGRPSYTGSTKNGVTTHSYGRWNGSFRLDDSNPSDGVSKFEGPSPSLRGGYAPFSQPLNRRAVGESFQVVVTGSAHEQVWGTDTYTDDSSLAAAAVHAGVLKDGEHGLVHVTIVEGRPAYEGSIRNGVSSSEWGAWGGSFKVEPVEKVLEPARIPAGLMPDVDGVR